jgi:hypothetical protein
MKPLLALLLCTFFVGCRTNVTPEAQVDDLKITTSIKTKLAGDMGLKTVPNIDVTSVNGIVTLAGTVDSAAGKDQAETIAKSVPQVVKVINNLQVVPKPTTSSLVLDSWLFAFHFANEAA